MRLLPCPSCALLVRVDERACPHCNTALRTITAPTSSAVLLGLALVGCPADDYREDLPAESSSTTAPTTTTPTGTSEGTSGDGSGSSTTIETTSIGSEAAYGVPETDSITDTTTGTGDASSGSSGTTDGSTGADSGSSDGGPQPLYGVMDSG